MVVPPFRIAKCGPEPIRRTSGGQLVLG